MLSRDALLQHGRRSFQRLRAQGSASCGTFSAPSARVDTEGEGKPPIDDRLGGLHERLRAAESEAAALRRRLADAEAQPALVEGLRFALDLVTAERDSVLSRYQALLVSDDELLERHAATEAELALTRRALESASAQFAATRAEFVAFRQASKEATGNYSPFRDSSVCAPIPRELENAAILQRWRSFTGEPLPGATQAPPESESAIAEPAAPRTPGGDGGGGGGGGVFFDPDAIQPHSPKARASQGPPTHCLNGVGSPNDCGRHADAASPQLPPGAVGSIIQAHLQSRRLHPPDRAPSTPPTGVRAPSPALAVPSGAQSGPALQVAAAAQGAESRAERSHTAELGAALSVDAQGRARAPERATAGQGQAAEAEAEEEAARLLQLEQLIVCIMGSHERALAESGSLSRAASDARAQLQQVGLGGGGKAGSLGSLGQPLLPPHMSRRLHSARARPGFFASLFGYGVAEDDADDERAGDGRGSGAHSAADRVPGGGADRVAADAVSGVEPGQTCGPAPGPTDAGGTAAVTGGKPRSAPSASRPSLARGIIAI